MSDPYAELDAEETRLVTQLAEVRSAKAVLRRVCGITDPPHGPSVAPDIDAPGFTIAPREGWTATLPAPHDPRRKPETPAGKPAPRRTVAASGERVAKVVAMLAVKPMTTSEIAEALGVSSAGNVSTFMGDRRQLFHKPNGPQSPWELTEAGRAHPAAGTEAASSAS